MLDKVYMTRHKNSVPIFILKHDYFKNSFFPSTVIEWNKLDSNIRNSKSIVLFKKRILAFMDLSQIVLFNATTLSV